MEYNLCRTWLGDGWSLLAVGAMALNSISAHSDIRNQSGIPRYFDVYKPLHYPAELLHFPYRTLTDFSPAGVDI
jgi:hypothetical protein